MNILALDTSSDILSVALRTEKGVYSVEAAAGLSHAELLFDAIDGAFRLARLERERLDLAACMEGPGSFTGLRIGFAAAKGLALALGARYVAVPTLDCAAGARAAFAGFVLPLLDAKQGRFFCRLYKNGVPQSGALDADVSRLAALLPADAPVLLAGPGAAGAFERLRAEAPALSAGLVYDGAPASGGAKDLLRFLEHYDTMGTAAGDFAAPVYVRPAV